jgi:LAO/AO transport system kinase
MARMISWAENRDERFPKALSSVYGRVGKGWRTGVTGPPGAGKSTLVNEMTRVLRERGETIGVLAIDPSSPFSGGALLGDRIRMEDRTLDEGVFIRSMASRGSHGGLARAAVDACDVMDAFGLATILLETVGVGQAEYDVLGAADTVAVVLCPGAGDGVQAMKAGLLEVADVLVVNKADLAGADRLVSDLEEAVHVRFLARDGWDVPVVPCSATTGAGVDEVIAAVDRHRAHLEVVGLDRVRRGKRLEQIKHVVNEGLANELWTTKGYAAYAEREFDGETTPYDVAGSILDTILAGVPEATIPSTRGES